MPSSRKEIRDSVLNTTRQENSQIGTLVNEFINITLQEINDPAWAFPNKNYNHLWSWLRIKTTFITVDETGDYVLPREIKHISLLRQLETPLVLTQVPDEKFFKLIPDPTEEGNPRFYRMWETEGVAVRLSSADTLNVVSDSGSDSGSAELAVSIVGYTSGILTSETYQLNGTGLVSGVTTFQAREIYVSKQKATTGIISIKRQSTGATILTLGPQERAARFKVVTLYPEPNSAITMYLEGYTRLRELTADSDVPQFDQSWHYVVRLGALAKVYQYLNKDNDFAVTHAMYTNAVKSMVAADKNNPNLISYLGGGKDIFPLIHVRRSEAALSQ